MIIPRKTVVIPRKTQVIPGITQQKQGFCYRNGSTGRGRRKSTDLLYKYIAAVNPVEKNPFILKTSTTGQRGRDQTPRSLSAGNRKITHTEQRPHNTQTILKMKLLE